MKFTEFRNLKNGDLVLDLITRQECSFKRRVMHGQGGGTKSVEYLRKGIRGKMKLASTSALSFIETFQSLQAPSQAQGEG